MLVMTENSIQVQVLCPSEKCKKCTNLLKKLEKLFSEMQIVAHIEIITDLNIFKEVKTWVLPTVLINGQIAARGYLPLKSKNLKIINQK